MTPTGSPDPAVLAENHLQRSVLDAVEGEYKHFTGDASPLGADSKAKCPVHLDNIRNMEKRLAPTEEALSTKTSWPRFRCKETSWLWLCAATRPGSAACCSWAQVATWDSAGPTARWARV
jgi:hypothetical protein